MGASNMVFEDLFGITSAGWSMKYKTALILLLILLLLSAFAQIPRPAGSSLSRPLFALPLPEGRTLDEGHDLGYI
jgi:hypothetical protein